MNKCIPILFFATLAMAEALSYTNITGGDNTYHILPIGIPRRFNFNKNTPAPAAAAAATTAPAAAVVGGPCPGALTLGCLTCDTANPTQCGTAASARGVCFPANVPYLIGCPQTPLCQATCA